VTPQEISDLFRAGRRALHRLPPVPNFSDLFTLSPRTLWALLPSFDYDILTPLLEDPHAATRPAHDPAQSGKPPQSKPMGCNEGE
jgi:hypothetical protein